MDSYDEYKPEDLITVKERVEFLMKRDGYYSAYQFLKDREEKDISRSTFYNILSGDGENIKRSTANRIAKAFNVSAKFVKDGGCEVGVYYESHSDYVVVVKGYGEIMIERTGNQAKAIEKLAGLRSREAEFVCSIIDLIIKNFRQ